MILGFTFKTLSGAIIDLDNRFNFGWVEPGNEKVKEILLSNDGSFLIEDISVVAKAHPSAQAGQPKDTYEAVSFSLSMGGPFVQSLDAGSLPPSGSVSIFAKFEPPASAFPGEAVFAFEARGSAVI